MDRTKYLSAGIWIGQIYRSPEKKNWQEITPNIAARLGEKREIIEKRINGTLGKPDFLAKQIPYVEADLYLNIELNGHDTPCEGYLRIKPCVIHNGPQFSKLWFILNTYEELSGKSVFDLFTKAEKISKPVFKILKDTMKDVLRDEFDEIEETNIEKTYDVIFKVAGSYSTPFNRLLDKSRSLDNLIELVTNSDNSLEKEYYLDLQAYATGDHNIKNLIDILGISNKKDFQWRYRNAEIQHGNDKTPKEEWSGYYAVFNDEKNTSLELTGFVGGEQPENIRENIFAFPTAIVNESIDVL